MTQYLRQSTAATLKLGPFVDTDGAATTGLTISQADVRLSKNGGNMAQKNESTSCTHDEIGMYDCPVDTTDTNTLGRLDVMVAESGALIHREVLTVLPATIYDQMFAASFPRGPVLASGTLGGTGNSTTALHLTGLAYADDDINGHLLVICDVSTGVVYSTYITDWANTGDLATVPTLPFTPQASTDTYVLLAAKKDPDVATILADTNDIQTRLPAALVSGRIDASVGAMAAGVVTAAAVATDAIDADAIADNAINAAAIATGAITAAKFAAGAIDAAAIAAGAIDAATFAADVDAEFLSYIVDDATRIDASALNTANVTTTPAISTAVAALQTYPKNVAIAAFMFYMEDTDGVALTGATVSTFISKDGGAFAATATATATEVSSGWYKVALTQTEANCDELAFRATATGARTCNMKMRLQG